MHPWFVASSLIPWTDRYGFLTDERAQAITDSLKAAVIYPDRSAKLAVVD